MLRAVVFDLDGTITELTLPLDAMRSDTKKFYIELGLPPDLLDPEDGISSTKMKAREYFLSHGMSIEEWESLDREIDEILTRHEAEAAKSARLIRGVLDVVAEVRKMGLKTAILTNNGRHAVEIVLERLPLGDYFDVIQTRNESPNPKPYPDGLLALLKKLSVSRDEAIYVGDARIDAAAAKRAGVRFWAVATGETNALELKKAGAERVFGRLAEILPALRAEIGAAHDSIRQS